MNTSFHALVLDLKNIEFIDSSTLTLFVKLVKKFNKLGKFVIICNAIPTVYSLFEFTGMTRFINVCVNTTELEDQLKLYKKEDIEFLVFETIEDLKIGIKNTIEVNYE